MKTYWQADVSVDGRCVVSLAASPSLSAALADAIESAVYYQAVYPGAKVAITRIEELCDRCNNNGAVRIRRPRSVKIAKCPECKGNKASGTLADIPFRMPNPANRIRLVQD